MNFSNLKEKKRYIELMKYFSSKIDEQKDPYEMFKVSLESVDNFMSRLDPEVSYIEGEEYNHLNYLINNRLNDIEKEIIFLTFGFLGKCHNKYEIARKLKVSVKFVTQTRERVILKLKKWLIDEDIVKK